VQHRDLAEEAPLGLGASPACGPPAQLQRLLTTHLVETGQQVERLNGCFDILGVPARAKPCKGMMGLVEEGEEVMSEGKKKDDAAADLALIGAGARRALRDFRLHHRA
jgi:ferritin-like metal-binding protein YciE